MSLYQNVVLTVSENVFFCTDSTHVGTGGTSVLSSGAGGTLSTAGGCSGDRGSSSGTLGSGSGFRGSVSGAGTCGVVVVVDVTVVDRAGWAGVNGGLMDSALKGGNVSSCVTGGRPGAVLGGWS